LRGRGPSFTTRELFFWRSALALSLRISTPAPRKKIALTLQNKAEKIAHPCGLFLMGSARMRNFLASFAGLGVPTGKGLSGILCDNWRFIPSGHISGGDHDDDR